MLKLLLIIILVGFVLTKVFGFFFKVLLGGSAAQRTSGRRQQAQTHSRKAADGNVNIDYIPKNGEAKKPRTFKGGEYVDYEEVR